MMAIHAFMDAPYNTDYASGGTDADTEQHLGEQYAKAMGFDAVKGTQKIIWTKMPSSDRRLLFQ